MTALVFHYSTEHVWQDVKYLANLPLIKNLSSLLMNQQTILQQDLKIAREFKPLEKGELDSLLKRVRPQAGDGRHERFKSTIDFDGPYHRQQHDFEPVTA